jgi:molybdopterin-guanine dinucleotide biosynthesis protein A
MPTGDAEPLAHTTGVVLAGGGSTRMGTSKAALEIGGEPLLRRVIGRLRLAFADLLVVGPAELGALAPGVRVIPDLRPGAGPLGGLEAALDTVATPRAFVVACDMPFVAPALARHMAELAASDASVDAVVLHTGRGREPLHAVYAVSALAAVREHLDAGHRSLLRLLDRLRIRELSTNAAAPFDPHGLSAVNANTPEEWSRAIELACNP